MLRPRARAHIFGVLFVSTLVLGSIWIFFFFNPKPEIEAAINELSSLQEHALQIIKEISQQMISLALLVIAGVGAVVLNKNEGWAIDTFVSHVLIGLCALFAIFSIFFGFLLHDKLIEMMSTGMFDANSPLISVPLSLQMYFLWFSVVLLSLFVMTRVAPARACQQRETQR